MSPLLLVVCIVIAYVGLAVASYTLGYARGSQASSDEWRQALMVIGIQAKRARS